MESRVSEFPVKLRAEVNGMEYVIETKNLTKRYSGKIVADNVNLHVQKGSIYGLLGRNGAGKTTVMKMMLRLAAPTGGRIFLFGEDTEKAGENIWRRVGSMIEAPGFYGNLTAAENLEILARMRGRHRKDSVENALAIVGLQTDKNKCFREFSLGMRQRLGIAAAIMHEPELLILDEPTNGLDPVGILELRNYLSRLRAERGTTILISSHVLSEIEQVADWIGCMHDGRLLEERNMQKLREEKRKYVEFAISDVKAAIVILEYEAGLSDYAVVGADRLRVYDAIERRAELNRRFVEKGIAVADIRVCEERLEDYFRKLIGGGNHDGHDLL